MKKEPICGRLELTSRRTGWRPVISRNKVTVGEPAVEKTEKKRVGFDIPELG